MASLYASKTLTVAWREFKATALTKAFIIGAVFVPVLMIGLAVLGPLLFDPTPSPLSGTLAILEPTGALFEAATHEFDPRRINKRLSDTIEKQLSDAGVGSLEGLAPPGPADLSTLAASALKVDFEITLDSHTDADSLDELKERVMAGDLLALATTVSPPSHEAGQGQAGAEKGTRVTLFVPSNMNVKHTDLLEDTLRSAAERVEIERAGLEVDEVRRLSRGHRPTTIRISDEGREAEEDDAAKALKMMVPMVFMMLIWIGAFVSGNYLLTTTIEEKSNKVVEVLLSAVSPLQLMTGKILGQALVGLIMTAMYAGLGIAALIVFAFSDLIDWTDLAYLVLYYFMAFFMIASIMAAIGSAVNELREAQSLMTPAMMLLMIPLFLWLPISDSPNGLLAQITSFIPPLIPFVMILRITSTEPVALWQIIMSLLVGYTAMLAMIWAAGKIFRVGVLMYGKPPSPLELIRWLRYS